MRYNFTAEQIADPQMGPAAQAVRACVHCGICTATCPTYVLLGDERDSPRGRIVLMKDMLEKGGAPTKEQVHHIDRCLSCLNCKTACPSSVNYQRLVDQARAHIQEHYKRPLSDRLLRWTIAKVMTRPRLVRMGLLFAKLGAPIAAILPGRLGAMAQTGASARPQGPQPTHFPRPAIVTQRIAIMPGCVQGALAPQIDAAVGRVLARRGIELVALDGAGCCGALPHHLGRENDARAFAKRAIMAFEQGRYDGVLITATGCSAQLKDYAQQFAGDPVWQPRAAGFAAAARDFAELCTPMTVTPPHVLRVAYHPACSLQNSLKLGGVGEALLAAAGMIVTPFNEVHLCCGSAGSYSILQPELSDRLRARKLGNIAAADADVLVSGNIGCLQHLAAGRGNGKPGLTQPILHIAELLDWAESGVAPANLELAAIRH
ncbi:MAG TPA: glycolate oxidase subunit GlcF [Rhizomicrobium sp.]|mgnify:FL=1|jgi:glycolate oxidase iron-sulfur subunit|nr:glycolate oxidase subunit GlcF [Rhizomicrobium sp.]